MLIVCICLLGNKSPSRNGSPKSPRSVTWNSNVPEKYSFTMRREFERAKEEADLIEQLRNVSTIITRSICNYFYMQCNQYIYLIAHRDKIEDGTAGGPRTSVNGRRCSLSLSEPR